MFDRWLSLPRSNPIYRDPEILENEMPVLRNKAHDSRPMDLSFPPNVQIFQGKTYGFANKPYIVRQTRQ